MNARATQAEFARLHSVSRKTVTKWKSEGRIVMAGDLVDVEASNASLESQNRSRVAAVTHGNGHSPGNGIRGAAAQSGNAQGSGDDAQVTDEATPFERAHQTGFHAGFASGVTELAFDLPAIASSAALAVGATAPIARGLAVEFAKRLIAQMAEVQDQWEIRHPTLKQPWSQNPPWRLEQFALTAEDLASR
jgi:hypothetical protein